MVAKNHTEIIKSDRKVQTPLKKCLLGYSSIHFILIYLYLFSVIMVVINRALFGMQALIHRNGILNMPSFDCCLLTKQTKKKNNSDYYDCVFVFSSK